MRFFDWAFKNGQAMAAELDYVPLPEPLVRQIADAWKSQVKDGAGKAVWN
jgi:phosphate transport system substrate-binding protein